VIRHHAKAPIDQQKESSANTLSIDRLPPKQPKIFRMLPLPPANDGLNLSD
jgi:hypothetical protein